MTARIELHAHRTDIHTRAKERHLETHRGSENTPSTHSNKKKKLNEEVLREKRKVMRFTRNSGQQQK